MLLLIKLAWRNLFRNKRRMFIAGAAIGIGLAALIFTDAIIVGMERNMIETATSSFLGQGQIHKRGFRNMQGVEITIAEIDSVISGLQSEEIVEHYTPRTITFGIISAPANFSSVSIVGVDPNTERWLSEVDESLIAGTYFSDENERSLLIGYKLAEIIEAGLGDRVVITASAEGGDLVQEMFRISGIFRFDVREMDQGLAFIRLQTAQEMLGLGKDVHEIAIRFTRPEYGWQRDLPFWKKYSRHGNEALGWNDILPQLEAAFELSDFSIFITGIILFGVVALGIINTLFMSLHERMFEFGVIRAIGTRPGRVGLLIILESASLALFSILLGMILGLVITSIVAKTGIDYRGVEMSGVTIKELLYPVLSLKQFILYPCAVFLFTLIIAAYPAIFAARLSPAEAIRKSL